MNKDIELDHSDPLDPVSSREERKATGRMVAVIAALLMIFSGFYHAWIKKIPVLAGVMVPALIMLLYAAWVLFLAKREKRRRLIAENNLRASVTGLSEILITQPPMSLGGSSKGTSPSPPTQLRIHIGNKKNASISSINSQQNYSTNQSPIQASTLNHSYPEQLGTRKDRSKNGNIRTKYRNHKQRNGVSCNIDGTTTTTTCSSKTNRIKTELNSLPSLPPLPTFIESPQVDSRGNLISLKKEYSDSQNLFRSFSTR